VPLHPLVRDTLANLRHRSGCVFRKPNGKPYKVVENAGGQIKTAFNGACRRAGITEFTPHGCRHTFATWHYAANRDLKALKEIGGWKSEKMLWRYIHINPDDLAPSVNNIPSISVVQNQESKRDGAGKANRKQSLKAP